MTEERVKLADKLHPSKKRETGDATSKTKEVKQLQQLMQLPVLLFFSFSFYKTPSKKAFDETREQREGTS